MFKISDLVFLIRENGTARNLAVQVGGDGVLGTVLFMALVYIHEKSV